MHAAASRPLEITAEINGGYHTPEELRVLFSRLTGRPVDESFGLFPPLLHRLRKKHPYRQAGFYQYGL